MVYQTFNVYRHPVHGDYTLDEIIVFGETVVRVYAIEDKENDLYESTFRLEKDGIWHSGGVVMWPSFMRDYSGKVIGVFLTMVKVVNGKFETVMTREVKRK